MGLLKTFFNQDHEKIEQRGDAFLKASDWGRAKLEFEKALDLLVKTSPDEVSETRLRDKLVQAKEALAQEHRRTGEELMEAAYYDDAGELLQLALDLTREPELIASIQDRLGEMERLTAGDIQKVLPESTVDDEIYPNDQDEETFMALCSALPEDVQEAYLSYGGTFKAGYLALNRGAFDQAVDDLSRAMEENPDPDSFISLELATAYLNQGHLDEARRLLETFLQHHPDALPGYQVLCEVLWEMGAFGQAEALLDGCPDDLKNSLAHVLLLGETLFQAGLYSDAASFYQGFRKNHAWNEPITRALANTYEALRDFESARDLYAEIMDQCRSCHTRIDPLIKRRFADISFDLGEHSPAILEIYLSLVQDDPGNTPFYFQKVSRIYTALGNEEEARRFKCFAQEAENEKG